jgi:hypothetical protein
MASSRPPPTGFFNDEPMLLKCSTTTWHPRILLFRKCGEEPQDGGGDAFRQDETPGMKCEMRNGRTLCLRA